MNRINLIQETRNILAKTGFYISDDNVSRLICFDIVARRDNQLIIIKILTNVDSFSKENARELMVLAKLLNGVPLLIGEHSSQKKIEPGIIYFRHNIPLVHISTLTDFFTEGIPPLIFAAPGGFYVNIDGEVLHKTREAKKISLGTLAEVAGVSRKAIQMYENGMSTMIDVAIRLEEFLDIPLVKPLEPFTINSKSEEIRIEITKSTGIENEIFNQLKELGYNVVPTIHCPFDALTKDSKVLIITGVGKPNKKVTEKARALSNLSKITEYYSVMFLEKMLRKSNLEGTPIIHTAELKKIADSKDIITLISERGD